MNKKNEKLLSKFNLIFISLLIGITIGTILYDLKVDYLYTQRDFYKQEYEKLKDASPNNTNNTLDISKKYYYYYSMPYIMPNYILDTTPVISVNQSYIFQLDISNYLFDNLTNKGNYSDSKELIYVKENGEILLNKENINFWLCYNNMTGCNSTVTIIKS